MAQKREVMSNEEYQRRRKNLEALLEQAKATRGWAETELETLESERQPEPELGAVVRFGTYFGGGTTWYQYVAVHTQAGWYMTGRRTSSYSWQGLVEWMRANDVKRYELMRATEIRGL